MDRTSAWILGQASDKDRMATRRAKKGMRRICAEGYCMDTTDFTDSRKLSMDGCKYVSMERLQTLCRDQRSLLLTSRAIMVAISKRYLVHVKRTDEHEKVMNALRLGI